MKKKVTAMILGSALIIGLAGSPVYAASPDFSSGESGYSLGCSIWNWFSDGPDLCARDPYFDQ